MVPKITPKRKKIIAKPKLQIEQWIREVHNLKHLPWFVGNAILVENIMSEKIPELSTALTKFENLNLEVLCSYEKTFKSHKTPGSIAYCPSEVLKVPTISYIHTPDTLCPSNMISYLSILLCYTLSSFSLWFFCWNISLTCPNTPAYCFEKLHLLHWHVMCWLSYIWSLSPQFLLP